MGDVVGKKIDQFRPHMDAEKDGMDKAEGVVSMDTPLERTVRELEKEATLSKASLSDYNHFESMMKTGYQKMIVLHEEHFAKMSAVRHYRYYKMKLKHNNLFYKLCYIFFCSLIGVIPFKKREEIVAFFHLDRKAELRRQTLKRYLHVISGGYSDTMMAKEICLHLFSEKLRSEMSWPTDRGSYVTKRETEVPERVVVFLNEIVTHLKGGDKEMVGFNYRNWRSAMEKNFSG